MYVPFLPVPMGPVNSGVAKWPDGSGPSGNVRTGFPTYQGPAIWYLFHTIATQFYKIEKDCLIGPIFVEKILSTVVTFMAYFGLTHPCPYCRFHFTQRVSRNDMDWKSLDQGAKNWFGDVFDEATGTRETQRISESEIYPLEYLF